MDKHFLLPRRIETKDKDFLQDFAKANIRYDKKKTMTLSVTVC